VNDPFGGWVYWTRFAPYELARVEISRGASTSVFGDRAMGGVVTLVSREPERMRLLGSYAGGNRQSHEVSAGFSNVWRRSAFTANGRAFTTDGYYIVPKEFCGAADRPAAVRFAAGDARLDLFGAAARLYFKLDALAEDRANGTALQRNSTGLGAAAVRYARETASGGLSLAAWHTREEFRSAFSAIATDRNSERLTSLQRVPAEGAGAGAVWNRRASRFHVLAGADFTRVEGYSNGAGGSLVRRGVFTQASFDAGTAKLFFGARHDHGINPSAGAAFGRGRFRARASVYRAFRAPTLNELYRDFRAGNAVTRANAALEPETAFGAEAGLDFQSEPARLSLTFYRAALDGLVTNVTLTAQPDLIVRERRNAGSAVARGAELNGRARRGPLAFDFGYLFSDSRFRGGARVPQVPRHQGSAQAVWTRGGTLLSAGARSYGSQFEDERSLRDFLLPGFATVQLLASRRIARGASLFAAVENALDRQFYVGFSPVPNTGAPRLWRAGLRWEGRLSSP
jgi:outer membrane receptor protein involved in Fe transport